MALHVFNRFQIKRVLLEKPSYAIYQVEDVEINQPFLLKTLKSDHTSLEEILKLKQEFDTLKEINSSKVIVPIEFGDFDNNFYLVLQNCNYLLFTDFLKDKSVDLEIFIRLCIELTEAVNSLHQHAVIIKSLSPEKILIDPENLQIKIIDISLSFNSEKGFVESIASDPEVLNYISPELTGRVNIKTDLRTDVYSLGILFYELLLGAPPFQNQDPIEIIHGHLAQMPTKPTSLVKEIPEALSEIVMKCIAKSPKDRYQSAKAILVDLRRCLVQWEISEMIDPSFIPGLFDARSHIEIPENLFGRYKELNWLNDVVEKLRQGNSEGALIVGPKGVGKTKLLQEFKSHLELTSHNVVFTHFEPQPCSVPLEGIYQIIRKLIRGLFKESQEKIDLFKQKLLNLEFDVKGVMNFIPELKLLVEEQHEDVQDLLGDELHHVLLSILKLFATLEHPLVLIIEDLQWADGPSLNFISFMLLHSRTSPIVFVGSCRQEDLTREVLKKFIFRRKFKKLILKGLSQSGVLQLLKESTGQKKGIKSFGQYIISQTQGNPLLIKKIINQLFNEAFFTYDRHAKAWTWDLEKIKEYSVVLDEKDKKKESVKTDKKIKSTSFQSTLDIASLIRASAVFSTEISLKKILGEVLRVLIVEAGATRAVFLMKKEEAWFLQGEKQKDKAPQTLQALPLETQGESLSLGIVHYVIHTHKKVIINNFAVEEEFKNDVYFKKNKIKSAACIPVMHQGDMSVILYLENNISSDVFSGEKIKILELLSVQIAASVENSNLYSRLEKYNHNLEEKVLERTQEIKYKNEELANIVQELRSAQNHLVESAKMAALGQIIAGIAHELNTPLGAVKASTQNLEASIKSNLELFPQLFVHANGKKLDFLTEIIARSLLPSKLMNSDNLRNFKSEMIKTYTLRGMDSAREVVEYLVDMGIFEDLYLQLASFGKDLLPLLKFAYNMGSNLKSTQNILSAVDRSSKIIHALKSYVHQGRSESFVPTDISEVMESVLTLYQHQLKSIHLEKHYEEVPLILARPNEIAQVWTNLIYNALQAMNYEGTLQINIFLNQGQPDKWVVIEITDTGSGIDPHISSKLFKPFFTTKERGVGSGLGLSISKKIIEDHSGDISFDSNPGKTVFTVKLPIYSFHLQK